MITLYEDNAGHLFLVHGNKAWGELETVYEGKFQEDAEAILNGETGDWTLPVYTGNELDDIVDSCEPLAIASFENGFITIHNRPGRAASRYILGDRRYNHEWVFGKDTVDVFIVDGKQTPMASYPLKS